MGERTRGGGKKEGEERKACPQAHGDITPCSPVSQVPPTPPPPTTPPPSKKAATERAVTRHKKAPSASVGHCIARLQPPHAPQPTPAASESNPDTPRSMCSRSRGSHSGRLGTHGTTCSIAREGRVGATEGATGRVRSHGRRLVQQGAPPPHRPTVLHTPCIAPSSKHRMTTVCLTGDAASASRGKVESSMPCWICNHSDRTPSLSCTAHTRLGQVHTSTAHKRVAHLRQGVQEQNGRQAIANRLQAP
jgi:hypothetical protein